MKKTALMRMGGLNPPPSGYATEGGGALRIAAVRPSVTTLNTSQNGVAAWEIKRVVTSRCSVVGPPTPRRLKVFLLYF